MTLNRIFCQPFVLQHINVPWKDFILYLQQNVNIWPIHFILDLHIYGYTDTGKCNIQIISVEDKIS